jgi:hypothetical protein
MIARMSEAVLSAWKGLRERDPLLAGLGLVHLALALLMALAIPFDGREILGIDPWIKPIKFALAIAIYVWSVAWIMADLAISPTAHIWASRLTALTMVMEMALIGLQSARGVPSHFNEATPLDTWIFRVMGGAIVANTIVAGWIGYRAFRTPDGARPGYLAGVRWGLVLFLIGSVVGGYMAGRLSHTVGAADGGPGLPFVNWSRVAGDLRIAHFLGIHALQILPVAGVLSDGALRAGASRRRVGALAAGLGVLLLLALVQALLGRPLIAVT